jgi:hypothetical protein
MKLTAIEPSAPGQDRRTFTCPKCKRVQRHIIDSAVTDVWQEPQRAIEAGYRNAVTHEIRDGRMIPKLAIRV